MLRPPMKFLGCLGSPSLERDVASDPPFAGLMVDYFGTGKHLLTDQSAVSIRNSVS